VLRRIAIAALFIAAAACRDDTLLQTPGSDAPDPTADGDGGTLDPTPIGGAAWGDPAKTRRAGLLRLAQLNVRRFFDTTCDSNNCAAGGYEEVASAKSFADRAAQIATGLARLQADVITLAEVESQVCLDAIQAKLKDGGYVYPIANVTTAGGPGNVNTAVLARGTLESIELNRQANPLKRPDGSSTTFTRELPEVHLAFGASKVIVFAAHFRSKVDDDPGRRLAEGQKTQELMAAAGAANASALVLLGGDLNDTPDSPPLLALAKDGALLRVAGDVPTEAQGTLTFNGSNIAIDHIFTTASHASSYVAKSTLVVRDNNATSGGFAGSDHATIYADFKLSN
jgi:predicted extracellular nuclease